MSVPGTPGFMSPRVIASPAHPTQNTNNGGSSSHHGSMSTGHTSASGSSSSHGSITGKSPRQMLQHLKPGTRRNIKLNGKTVRITQGFYKGHIGVVKDATDSAARVELHSKCLTISVDLERLAVVDAERSFNRTPGSFATPVQFGSQTPMGGSGLGSRTPMYGSQTPLHDGSRTPHYGSATPRYDGSSTPNPHNERSSAWDPTAATTPRNDFEEDWDEQPPSASLNPTTPGYSAETPESHGPYTPGSSLNYMTHSPYTAASPLDIVNRKFVLLFLMSPFI
jgi:transcription elongation factor SPT5